VAKNEHCCKVGWVANKYQISPGVGSQTLDDQLAKRWLGEDEFPEMSLRSLVDWFHKHMLRTRYTEHGRSTLEPHLKSDYEVLKDPENDNHKAVLSDLEHDGIDGEELVNDFVSPATLYRHLTGCLDVEKGGVNGDSSSDRAKLEYVENTAEMYVSDLLSAWENSGKVPRASEASVAVRIYLECSQCTRQTNIRTVQQRGYVCADHMSTESEGSDAGSE